uniref:Uncharacterized protein n=1 Tax=Aegilops tauschii subsp. strangulata TaxID=200361 RepID=A0A453PZI3_AEGTS
MLHLRLNKGSVPGLVQNILWRQFGNGVSLHVVTMAVGRARRKVAAGRRPSPARSWRSAAAPCSHCRPAACSLTRLPRSAT